MSEKNPYHGTLEAGGEVTMEVAMEIIAEVKKLVIALEGKCKVRKYKKSFNLKIIKIIAEDSH